MRRGADAGGSPSWAHVDRGLVQRDEGRRAAAGLAEVRSRLGGTEGAPSELRGAAELCEEAARSFTGAGLRKGALGSPSRGCTRRGLGAAASGSPTKRVAGQTRGRKREGERECG